jgi:hypothetical protein
MRKRIWTEEDLVGIHLEHYLVAKSMDGDFSVANFNARYRKMFPARNSGSFLVSDYAYNNNQKAKHQFPSFLERVEKARYRFIGLDEGQAKKYEISQ